MNLIRSSLLQWILRYIEYVRKVTFQQLLYVKDIYSFLEDPY